MALRSLVKSMGTIPIKLINLFPNGNNYMYSYVMQQAKEMEKYGDTFCSIYCRPKFASQVISVEQETDIHRKTAIIMQGPLIADNDFTVETVKIYGKIYPGTKVIVSTWKNEPIEIISTLKQLRNCVLVLNELPKYSGMLNLNYQIASTLAGIKMAKELGCDYVFKTRCDFRFVKIGLIEFLVGLCKEFPIDKDVYYQSNRIVIGGDVLASFFRAFWLADRMSFGSTNDMYAYWNYEMDEIDMPKSAIAENLEKNPKTWREVTESKMCAEPRILLNYLKRMEGSEPVCSVEKFWEVLKKQFITVSFEETGAYWWKAYPDETRWKGLYYGRQDSSEKCLCYNWDFAKWLALYMGSLKYKDEYEQFQEKNIGFK